MSRLFKKNNSVSRVVALWLVFIMMATPFFAHAGIEKDSKAATPPAFKIDALELESAEIKNGTGGYYIESGNVVVEKYHSLDSLTFSAPDNASDGKVVWQTPKEITVDSNGYTSDGYEIKLMAVASDGTLVQSISSSDTTNYNSLKSIGELNITDDSKVGVYVKLNVKNSNSQVINEVYTLQRTYEFKKASPFAGTTDVNGNPTAFSAMLCTKDSQGNLVELASSNWYNSVYINITNAANIQMYIDKDNTIGEVKYCYAEYSASVDLSVQDWKAIESTTQEVDIAANIEGEYQVYLGYFVDGTLVDSYTIATPVKIDNKAPNIDMLGSGLYYSFNGVGFTGNDLPTEENAKEYGSNSVLRRDRLGDYALYLNMEGIAGSPVDTVKFNVNGMIYAGYPLINDGSTYRNRLSFNTVDGAVWKDDETNNFAIEVTDKAGNSSTFTIPGGFTFADPSHLDIDLSLEKLDGTPVSYSADEDIIAGENYNLVVTYESYEAVKSVEIKNNDTQMARIHDNGNLEIYYNAPYYKSTIKIQIPGNALLNNAIYEDMAVTLYNASDIALNATPMPVDFDLLYDNTDPIMLNADNTAYTAPDSTIWLDAKPIISFKASSGSGTYESNITSVTYSIDGVDKGNLSPDANGIYIIPESEIIESASADGTKIVIVIEDEAGNIANDGAGYEIVYKYDKSSPEFDNSDFLYILDKDNVTHLDGNIWVDFDYKLGVRGTDDGTGVQYIYYTYICNGGTEMGPYFIAEPGASSTPIVLTNPKDIDIEVGGPFSTNSEYTLKVYLQDYAGNKSDVKTISFANDSEIPSISTIKLQKEDASTSTWVDVDVAGLTTTAPNGAPCIYIDPTVNYRYEVTLYDSYGNIDESSITISDTDKYTVYNDGNTTDNLIYLEIDRSKISTSIPDTVTLTIKDEAGNESLAQTTSPGLLVPSDEVFIKAYLVDSMNNAVDINSLTETQKQELLLGTEIEYIVRVDYFSSVEIDPATTSLKYGSDIAITPTTSSPSNVKSDVDQMYHYIVDYTLPTGTNLLFDNITATASNMVTPTAKTNTVNLIDILYDDSEPVIYEDNNSSNPDVEFSDNGVVWCTSVNEQFVVKSGDGTQAHESKIKSVKVSINGGEPVEQITDGNAVESFTGSISLPDSSAVESPSAAGTTVAVTATDAAGNSKPYTYVYYIDTTQPTATLTVNDKTSFTDDITGMPTIKATAKDTLTLQSATIYVQAPNGTTYTKTYHNAKEAADNITKEATYTLADIIGAENVTDGTYSVYLKSIDNVGHETNSASVSFTLDNTLPTVTAKITSGTVSTKSSYYYNTDVTVTFTKSDKNMEFITVKDGDKTVDVKWSDTPDANGVYTGTATFTAEGAHSVTISAQDNAGNQSAPTTVSFLIDKTKPVVSTTLGGVIYTDESGFKYFTSNVSLGASVSDTNEDKKDLNYQIIQAKPDQEVTTSSYIETSARSFDYTEEADYTINLFAVDLADNTSATRTVKFRVDKNAPKLTIGGVGNGAASSATTVSFTMEEAFWKDASGKITIYRKPGEGQGEELLKTIDVTPTAFETVVRETLTETGIYRIEFSATDRAGHSSATNTTFTIDKDAPVVTLTSADNYALTDEAVPTTIEITDDFYITKKITLSGTRTDIDGKVNNIDFGDYNPAGNPTIIYQNFEEDGIYDIEVTVTDVAGNSDTKSVHFTIDKTDPVIGDLPDIDGKILTSFSWEEDLDELVSDLTVCDVHMYLNGSEYDGESAIEDGSYTLLITAEDELGHKVEKQVSFILDTKAPVFIVTGVEDGEVKNEEYAINVSLQLEEDTLTSVKLNGEDVLVSNNTCTISVTEKGEYVLEMTAIDEAGNESSMKLEFKYGEEVKSWLWIIIVAASVLLLGGIGFIVWKKKKDK